MTDHFVKNHESKDARKWTNAGIQMQAPFEGELKKWFEIIDRSAMNVKKKQWIDMRGDQDYADTQEAQSASIDEKRKERAIA